jgi:hypothetical protein
MNICAYTYISLLGKILSIFLIPNMIHASINCTAITYTTVFQHFLVTNPILAYRKTVTLSQPTHINIIFISNIFSFVLLIPVPSIIMVGTFEKYIHKYILINLINYMDGGSTYL